MCYNFNYLLIYIILYITKSHINVIVLFWSL